MATTAAELFSRAAEARQSSDFANSARLYAEAIQVQPHMAEVCRTPIAPHCLPPITLPCTQAYLNVAWVQSELSRTAEAEYSYRHGLRLRRWPAETAAAAWHNVGVIAKDAGRAPEATAAFESALQAKPDFGPSLEVLGQETKTPGKGNPGEYTGDYVDLIKRANDHYSRGENAEAGMLYRQAQPLRDPRADGSAYVGLGAALHGAGRLAEAKHVLANGAKLNPRSPGMLPNLAITLTGMQARSEPSLAQCDPMPPYVRTLSAIG